MVCLARGGAKERRGGAREMIPEGVEADRGGEIDKKMTKGARESGN